MADDLDEFWVHTISVRTKLGNLATGPAFADPVTVPCFVDGGVKVVRNAQGDLIVGAAPVYASTGYQATFTPDTEVTMPNGRVLTVVAVTAHTSGDLDLPDHIEITMQ